MSCIVSNMHLVKTFNFWNLSYQNGWFVRLSIVHKVASVIGPIELYIRVSEDEFNNMGILRVDVRSNYENEGVLYDMITLITPHISEMLNCNGILTKVAIYTVERTKAVQRIVFTKSEHLLVGKTEYAYDGHWIIK